MKLLLAAACIAAVATGCTATPSPPVGAPPPVATATPAVRDLAARGPSVQERLDEIRRRIQAEAHFPETALRRGVFGVTTLRFRIDDGEPRDVEILESSGSLALDHAARQAALRARDLPFVIGRPVVPVRFEAKRVPTESAAPATD